jgi:hypothetical protein
MEGERIPKIVLEWKPMGRRNRRRPRKRWIEDRAVNTSHDGYKNQSVNDV